MTRAGRRLNREVSHVPQVTLKQLLEAGVHFGHQTSRWNPKMRTYIFTARNGIHIIDLQKTVRLLDDAYDFVRATAASGRPVLFVGTKKQAQETVQTEAARCGMFFVNRRWMGGMLTNFSTMQKRIRRLFELRRMQQDGRRLPGGPPGGVRGRAAADGRAGVPAHRADLRDPRGVPGRGRGLPPPERLRGRVPDPRRRGPVRTDG